MTVKKRGNFDDILPLFQKSWFVVPHEIYMCVNNIMDDRNN